MLSQKNIDKLLSGRFITTVLFASTYCLAVLTIVIAACLMIFNKQEGGKDLLIFIVGNFTGTVIGSIVAYHFKKEEKNNV